MSTADPVIVLVVKAFPTLSETFIVSKFHGLRRRGWRLHIVSARSDERERAHFPALSSEELRSVHRDWPAEPRLFVPFLFPLAFLHALTLNPRGTLAYWVRGLRRFGLGVFRHFYRDAAIVARRPRIVHFAFGSLAAGRTHLKELLGCRLAVSFRGFDLNYVGLDEPSFYRQVWEEADVLHFLGEDLWNRALARGCPRDKPRFLISPAIDASFFAPEERNHGEELGTEARPFRILSVGRLHWKKGYEDALEAVRSLLDDGLGCEYRIVGDGEYLGALAFARHQLGLERAVEFLGPQSPSEVKRQGTWADVLLHPAVSEGFGNAVLEAQAMGLPVVTTDADGLPENVENGWTGFVVEKRNPEALAEKLRLLAEEPSLRERMGRAGRERVLRRFTVERQLDAFESFYRELLEASIEGTEGVR